MIKRCLTVLLTAIAFVAAAPAPAAPDPEMIALAKSALPTAPAGFEWAIYRNCAVLKPNGWNDRTLADDVGKKVIGAYAFSPEQFSEQKQFEHGFTTQVVAGFKALNKVEPSKGAVLMMKPITDSRPERDILLFKDNKFPDRISYVLRYRDAPAGKTPIIIHKYMIARDGDDTLHIFTYESPEAQWEANWKAFGETIMGKVAIIPFLSASP
jgi:hypothetical protein